MSSVDAIAAAARRVLDPDSTLGIRVERAADGVLCAVDLDRLDPSTAHFTALAARWLTASERARLDTLPVAKRRREWFGGRIAAKRAVEVWSGGALRPRAVHIGADAEPPTRGRPRVEIEPDSPASPTPRIGISHSGRWAVAIAADGPVGLDVERVRRFPPALYRSAFCAQEHRAIESADLPDDAATALWWTCKEALLKSDGAGIGDRLRSVEVRAWRDGRFDWSGAADSSLSLAQPRSVTGLISGGYAVTIVLHDADPSRLRVPQPAGTRSTCAKSILRCEGAP